MVQIILVSEAVAMNLVKRLRLQLPQRMRKRIKKNFHSSSNNNSNNSLRSNNNRCKMSETHLQFLNKFQWDMSRMVGRLDTINPECPCLAEVLFNSTLHRWCN